MNGIDASGLSERSRQVFLAFLHYLHAREALESIQYHWIRPDLSAHWVS